MQYKISEEDYVHGGSQKDFYGPDDVETADCPLCGSHECTHIYTERGHLGVVRCQGCDLIYTSPRAKAAEMNYSGDIEAFYAEARLIFKGKKPHHRDPNYDYEIGHIRSLKPAGTLVDIGCNMGFFLRKAAEAGYAAIGVEPSAEVGAIARREFGLHVIESFFEEAGLPDRSADVVTMIDVFEHVTQPRSLLVEAQRVLKDDGLLCIKVPNGDYNVFKLTLAKAMGREAQHDLFDSCEHVVHYTYGTMKRMLEENGFRIKRFIVPLPIHPPIWANLVGHYYQYPSPFLLDWKRITLRKLFYRIGQVEATVMPGKKSRFAPDLMFIAEKAA